jgi:hypothetical protein
MHNVTANLAASIVTFGSQDCITHCNDAVVTVSGVTEEPPEQSYPVKKDIFALQAHPPRPFQGNIVML